MKYISSELDRHYNLNLNCATHYEYVENPQGMLRPHHHNDYELYFLMSGNRKYFIENTIYTLRPNQIVLFKPNIPHQVTVNLNIPYERQLLYVTPQLFTEIINNNPCLNKITNRQFFNLSEENFNKALDYISKINEEFKINDLYSSANVKSILCELLIFIERNNDSAEIIVDKSDLRIQTAIDFILENYAEPITMYDCAKLASMNYHAFSKAFQNITAIGFKQFLSQIRIDKSCELLETTNYSISKIAELVGFSTANHFSTTFKTFHKISPTTYRRNFINKS